MPNFRQNFISASHLFQDGYIVNFRTNVTISKDGNFICQGKRHNNLYYLHPNSC